MDRRKLVLFIASTLDGYIATKDHDLTWLFNVEGEGDNGISAFYNTIDTIIMGRTTYEWVMNHEETFPYKDKQCYVFSRTSKDDIEYINIVNDDVISFTNELMDKKGKNIWLLGGSELISHFVKEKLIDEIIVTIAPVLLGDGIRLFKHNDFQTHLSLNSINRFNQFVELRYSVLK